MKATSAALASTLAATALAHGTVPSFKTDGVDNGGFLLEYYYAIQNGQEVPDVAGWYAENLDNGFVEPNAYSTDAIICHKAAKPGAATASVKAGGKIDFQWSEWPESHVGPVLTYIAPCAGNDCTSVDKTALKWTKIDAVGIDIATQKWAATTLIENNNTWTTTVPANLAAGSYVFRHEIIAMHGAGSENGAQNYPQCFNIEVTGSGTQQPPAGVAGTELYTPDHPGILFNPYQQLESYDMPGPELWTGASSSSVERRAHARDFA